MKRIVKISGEQGSGKTHALQMIAKATGYSVLYCQGNSTVEGITQALRGRQNVVVLIDDCPQELLEQFEGIVPGSAIWGRIECLYVAVKP